MYVNSLNGKVDTNKLIVWLSVDDLLVTGNISELIAQFKTQMLNDFEMSDLSELNYFLGVEFTKAKHRTMMHQTMYTQDLLKRYKI